MPTETTARDIIYQAHLLLQVAAAEEVLTAWQAEQGLSTLNDLLGSWSLERLLIYNIREHLLTWPGGQGVQTWGPSGQIVDTRPLRLEPDAWRQASYASTERTPLSLVSPSTFLSYQSVPPGGIAPTIASYAPDMPDGRLMVAPTPQEQSYLLFLPWMPFPAFASLDSPVTFPPGYARLMTRGLAVELAPSFGREPSPTLLLQLLQAKSSIKLANTVIEPARLDAQWTFFSGGRQYA